MDPDSGQLSASLFVHTVSVDVQLFRALASSNPPSLMTFSLFGVRHTQALFVQLKVPEGQSATEPHCLQVPLTQIGADGDEHVPHAYIPPQPFGAEPQFLPEHALALGVGTHWHVVGVPLHASLLAHAVQRLASSQPWFASVVTQFEPHFFVPAPHTPMTQAESRQTRVPEPGAGQLLASQVVSEHP